MEPTGPDVDVQPAVCPFCHEVILAAAAAVACLACGTLHHAACVLEGPTCGECSARLPLPLRVAPPATKRHWAFDTVVGALLGGCAAAALSPYAAPILLGAVFGGMVGMAVGRDR